VKLDRNLLLLTIDAWRADFCDTFEGAALTPHLRSRAAHTVRFPRVWTHGPWTTPGLVPMFTGEPPPRHGVHWAWSEPREDTLGLAAVLRAAGYETPNLCYLNDVGNYRNLGFAPQGAPAPPKDPEDPVLFDALRALARGRGPFFAWYHYKFVHLPYWPAEAFRRALGVDDAVVPPRLRRSVFQEFVVERWRYRLEPDEDRALVRRLYAAGVLQLDAWLGRVLSLLDDLGLTERTTVVLTADHGDELLERGHVGHASTAEHALLTEELLRIPLYVLDARVRGPREDPVRVQGADLFATLLGLLGVGAPSHAGVDLSARVLNPGCFQAPEGFDARPFLFHSARMGYRTPRSHDGQALFGLSDGRRKVVVERYDAPRAALYDLVLDPGETRPETDGPALDAACAALDAAWAAGAVR
jgi:arylsulfatase A-like enzyme